MKDMQEENTQEAQPVDVMKFEINQWTKLDRFLILGSDASVYVCGNSAKLNASALIQCVAEDGVRVVDRIVEISAQGRAFKNDPAIYALAYCLKKGNLLTRKAAGAVMHKVCRTGTHLFQLCGYISEFGGWGRIVHRSLQNWYLKKNTRDLGYQMMKYQSREGWSHGDVLGKARPKPEDEVQNELFKWAVHGTKFEERPEDEALARIWGMQQAAALPKESEDEAVKLIQEFDLPRESTPTWFRNVPKVQAALLEKMPLNALVRNLGPMTASGMFEQFPQTVNTVVDKLSNQEYLMASRVHPMSVLQAIAVYQQGGGIKGTLRWNSNDKVKSSLNGAFYKTFQNVVPTNKRICLALDVSGSMTVKASGLEMSCRDASSALALVTVATEPRTEVIGFTCAKTTSSWMQRHRVSTPLWENPKFGVGGLDIMPSRPLQEVVQYVAGLGFGGTDCAAPILWALEEGKEFDLFVVYTDSETNSGDISPHKALQEYRRVTGIPARLVVVGMMARPFSIANPNDPGMLDVVGCDTATPRLISEFAVGRI